LNRPVRLAAGLVSARQAEMGFPDPVLRFLGEGRARIESDILLKRRDGEVVVSTREVYVGRLVEIARPGAGGRRALSGRRRRGRSRRGGSASRGRPDGLELERQRVDAAAELGGPGLEVVRLPAALPQPRSPSPPAPPNFR